jgi:hypothetical protein
MNVALRPEASLIVLGACYPPPSRGFHFGILGKLYEFSLRLVHHRGVDGNRSLCVHRVVLGLVDPVLATSASAVKDRTSSFSCIACRSQRLAGTCW